MLLQIGSEIMRKSRKRKGEMTIGRTMAGEKGHEDKVGNRFTSPEIG